MLWPSGAERAERIHARAADRDQLACNQRAARCELADAGGPVACLWSQSLSSLLGSMRSSRKSNRNRGPGNFVFLESYMER